MMSNFKKPGQVAIRDTTLREGLDMPGMDQRLSRARRWRIAQSLFDLGVREFDIVHPGRVAPPALKLARRLKRKYGRSVVVHGAVYACNPKLKTELASIRDAVDELDLVMPVIAQREPCARKDKERFLLEAIVRARAAGLRAGAGLANSTQTDVRFLLKIARRAAEAGARQIVLYDSIGNLDPLETMDMVRRVKAAAGVPILYHCHNDLGLAAANSLCAVYAGARTVDATINGVGDRAGNAPLEQIAMLLHLKGIKTGIRLDKLKAVSDLVERATGVKRAALHPVTGDPRIIFAHVSPKHRPCPQAFAAFDPALLLPGKKK